MSELNSSRLWDLISSQELDEKIDMNPTRVTYLQSVTSRAERTDVRLKVQVGSDPMSLPMQTVCFCFRSGSIFKIM